MHMNMLKAAFVACLAYSTVSNASIIRLTEDNFLAEAGLITFSEFGIGTTNPIYTPDVYGGGAGSPTVTFGGYFLGQMLSMDPGADCPGAAASACVVGNPSGPLSLDAGSPETFIATDGSNPTSPVLSGSPLFNGPIAALFDVDVAAVGFDGGFFNAAESTAITAFARDGSLVGSVSNMGTGIEFLGLASADENVGIAGFFLDLVGAEPAGFAIDNIRFGTAEQVDVVPNPPSNRVPAPGSLALLGLGLLALGRVRRSKR